MLLSVDGWTVTGYAKETGYTFSC